MTIALLDTTIVCNIIPVPGFNQHAKSVLNDLKEYVKGGAKLFLPVAAIVETGNHIAHCHVDGSVRRKTADKFVTFVRAALDGQSPFTPTRPFELDELSRWLADFPDCSMRGIGMGDLSIMQEYKQLCDLHGAQEVFIWSHDKHLSCYHRAGR